MGMFDELYLMVEYYSRYNRETGENQVEYDNLREEIDLHMNGEIPFESLSKDAQNVMKDWETFVSDMQRMEEGRIGPLDV